VKEEVVWESALLKQADVSKGQAVSTSEFLISNFRHVLNIVYFLLGDSSASKFYVPKRRHIKSRRRVIAQKKAYNIRIVANLEIWNSHIRDAEDKLSVDWQQLPVPGKWAFLFTAAR